MENYTCWTNHGENNIGENNNNVADDQVDGHDGVVVEVDTNVMMDDDVDANDYGCNLDEMLQHTAPLVHEQARGSLDNLDVLKKASKDILYDKSMGCDDKFTLLHLVLELMKLKESNGWSDKSFTELLLLLRDMLPKPNKLPASTYLAKKLIAPLALDVVKIHACLNHCILYHKDYEHYVIRPSQQNMHHCT